MATSLVNLFGYIVIVSLFLVTCFYWPNHNVVAMKSLCWQMSIIFLTGSYFMFGGLRIVKDIFPSLLLVYCLINMLTHGLSGNTSIALSVVFFFSLGVCILSNGLHVDFIPKIKKAIVILGLINVCSYFLELSGIRSPFLVTGGYLPTGFMSYPAHFALLMCVSMFFAWEWKKFLCIPLFIGLIFANELSAWVGLGIVIAMQLKSKRDWIILGIIFLIFIGLILLKHGYVNQKLSVRLSYWIPVFVQSWARPIDGWGIGSYAGLVNNLLPNMPKNAWLWLHNEPIQAFFEGGILLIVLLTFWIIYIYKKIVGAYYEKPYIYSFILFASVSLGHSPFHFMDTLWLFMVIYGMFQCEHFDADQKWDLSNAKAN